jgi:dTMP kinase
VHSGSFIVIEGPDGSGKSTQAAILASRLEGDGYACTVTEQPGGSTEGKHIRDLLLNPALNIDAKTELFLFLADRADHVHKVIQPALDAGKIVISSRYFYSTLVYQGMVREVAPYDFLLQMNLFAVDDLIPDMVFFIDVEASHGLSRAKNSSREKMNYMSGDRIEREGVDFHRRVRDGYRKLAGMNTDLFITIDATGKDRNEIGNLIYGEWCGRRDHD